GFCYGASELAATFDDAARFTARSIAIQEVSERLPDELRRQQADDVLGARSRKAHVNPKETAWHALAVREHPTRKARETRVKLRGGGQELVQERDGLWGVHGRARAGGPRSPGSIAPAKPCSKFSNFERFPGKSVRVSGIVSEIREALKGLPGCCRW